LQFVQHETGGDFIATASPVLRRPVADVKFTFIVDRFVNASLNGLIPAFNQRNEFQF
jgi:hypothetical protein